jgi:hypothetical protein
LLPVSVFFCPLPPDNLLLAAGHYTRVSAPGCPVGGATLKRSVKYKEKKYNVNKKNKTTTHKIRTVATLRIKIYMKAPIYGLLCWSL